MMSDFEFNREYELSELVGFVTDKINANKVTLDTYISTENMLLDRGGVESAIKLPTAARFNHYKNGDTLFSNIRTYFRKVWLAEFEGGASADVLIFRSKDSNKLDPVYLYFILSNEDFINYTVLTAKGAKMPRGDKAAIMQYKFFLPDIEKQRKVGNDLLTINIKIELNRKVIKTLEQISQAIFKSWFIDFEPVKAKIITKQNGQDPVLAAMCAISGKTEEQLKGLEKTTQQQLKTTAALFPDALVVSELGEIPEGWDIKPLSEIAENHSTTFDFSKVDEVVFVNTGDVLEGRFLHKNYSSKEGLPGQAKKTIKKDDILYSEIRPKNKRFAYVTEDCDDYVVSTKFMIVRSLGFVQPRYLYQILRQETTIQEFNLIAESRSGTFPQITFDSIGYIPVVVPSKVIQNNFMEFFAPIIEKIDLMSLEGKSLEGLRDNLLPKLLSGELLIKGTQMEMGVAIV